MDIALILFFDFFWGVWLLDSEPFDVISKVKMIFGGGASIRKREGEQRRIYDVRSRGLGAED